MIIIEALAAGEDGGRSPGAGPVPAATWRDGLKLEEMVRKPHGKQGKTTGTWLVVGLEHENHRKTHEKWRLTHILAGWWFSWNMTFIFPETVGNVIIIDNHPN